MKKPTKLQEEACKLYETGITGKMENYSEDISFAYYQESYHSPRYYSIKRDDMEAIVLTKNLFKYLSTACDGQQFDDRGYSGYNTTRKELKYALQELIPEYLLPRKAFTKQIAKLFKHPAN
jgi:hypothetical protein